MMKKTRSFGSYFLFLIREGLFRGRELLGWRGIAFLVIIAYMLIDTFEANTEIRGLMFQGVGVLWMVFLFPPRMGKLLYLLPFSVKERMRYLRTYLVTYLSFFVILFILIGGVISLISGYSYLLWMRSFVFCAFPFLLLYSGGVVKSIAVVERGKQPASGWFFSTRGWYQQDTISSIKEECTDRTEAVAKENGQTTPRRKKWSKQSRIIALEVGLAIIPALQSYGNWMFTGLYRIAPWTFYASGILAYGSAIACLVLFWKQISAQLMGKGNSGKEEYGCSL